jgi:hypothetical protein
MVLSESVIMCVILLVYTPVNEFRTELHKHAY